MDTSYIIKTMFEQLGGRKFILMTGARLSYGVNKQQQPYLRCLLADDLQTKSAINCCVITYDYGQDLYIITFAKLRDENYHLIKQIDNVYAEDLIPLFESETGLCCRMPILIEG